MIETDPRVILQRACAILAADDPDQASEQNGVGFSKYDSEFGHSLAGKPAEMWTPRMAEAALRLLTRYRGQLARAGIDITAVTLPVNPLDVPSPIAKAPTGAPTGELGIKANTAAIVALQARARYYRIDFDAARAEWVIRFPFDRELVNKVHMIPGREWNRVGDKTWRVPVQESAVNALLQFAGDNDFTLSDEADAAASDVVADIAKVVAVTNESVKASEAADADLDIPGLGGTLRPFQRAGVKYALDHDGRVIIGDDMGLGKTVEALAIIQHELAAMPLVRAVVVCPASLKLNWVKEAITWLPEIVQLHGSSLLQGKYGKPMRVEGITVLNGSARDIEFRLPNKADGTPGGRAIMRTNDLSARILVLNYDILGKHLPMLQKLKAQGVLRVLVADESHYIKNTKANRTKLALDLAKDVPVRLALTGTPVMNRPKELISQLNFLDRIDDFGGFAAFVRKYCMVEYTGDRAADAAGLLDLNRALRATCFVRRRKADVLKELDAKTRVPLPMEISNRRAYVACERDLVQHLRAKAAFDKRFLRALDAELAEIADPDERARTRSAAIAEHQREAEASGMGPARALVLIENLKQLSAHGKLGGVVEWVEDFLETGEKLVLFVSHKDIAHTLAAKFQAPLIIGDTPMAERNKIVDAFQQDRDPRLLVMNLQAGGVGLTLTAASNVAFVELGWNPAVHDQAEDRVHRIGQLDAVTAWYFLGQQTIDEDIAQLIEQKRRVVDASTDGIVRNTNENTILGDLIDRIMARAGETADRFTDEANGEDVRFA